ncbi:MAG TPA: phosphotransferase [Candidatus Limnocylindria bacterium]
MATADVLATAPPALTLAQAEALARATFGVEATARPLVSERDQNFRLTDAHGEAWVLKVSNAAEDRGVVEMEVAAIEHIAAVDPELPVPIARPALSGDPIGTASIGGATHLVRLLPLLPGRTADPRALTPAELHEIGSVVARIGAALREFRHPAAGRAISWDQQHLPALFGHADLIEPGARRDLLDRVIDRFNANVLPAWPALRTQVIHNDVTLDNLLLGPSGGVTGIIDFGDMAHTARVLDIPATLQSLVRQREDILDVAAHFLAGYAAVQALEGPEAALLGDLLAGRMAQTILISVVRTAQYPDNAYIHGWSEPAWELLEQMEAIGFDEAGRRLAVLARGPQP